MRCGAVRVRSILVCGTAVVVIAGGLFGTALAASGAPGMTILWKNTQLSPVECAAHAETLMRNAGLTFLGRGTAGPRDDPRDIGVWGSSADHYLMNIHCVESKQMAMFAVAGEDQVRRHQLLDPIYDGF